MNFLPKDLEDIIVDYKTDLEKFDELTYNELIKEKLSYKERLNNELKKEQRSYKELFFFSQKIGEIKDRMINLLHDTNFCNGCDDHHEVHWDICEHCDKQFCEQHFGDLCFTCDTCSAIFCEDCGGECNSCGNNYCKKCQNTTDLEDKCDKCWENPWF